MFIRELFTKEIVTYITRPDATINKDHECKTHCTKKKNFKIPQTNTTIFGSKIIRRIGLFI